MILIKLTPRDLSHKLSAGFLPAISALILGLATGVAQAPLLVAEQDLLARLQTVLPAPSVPNGVVIVAIDDLSLAQAANTDLLDDRLLDSLGSWPWPRKVYQRLLERLSEAGVRAVAFDVLFDTNSVHGDADDQAFSSALSVFPSPLVLGSQVLEPRHGDVGSGLSLLSPLPQLSNPPGGVVRPVGLLNGIVESDGSIRQPPASYGNYIRNQTNLDLPSSLGAVLHHQLSGATSNDLGRWQPNLRFYGPPSSFPTISIWSLLERRSFEEEVRVGRLRNAVVFVGPTASSFQDRHNTAYSGGEGMPGVEIHATEYSNLVFSHGWHLLKPSWLWATCLSFLLFLTACFLGRYRQPVVRLAIGLGFISGYLALDLALLARFRIAFPLLSLSVATAITAGASTIQSVVKLQLERRRLKRTLTRYLSPAVAEEITLQPDQWNQSLVGRRCDVVVLMTDIRGFTEMTTRFTQEGRESELVARLNQYFEMVVEELMAEGATIDKFIGDAALAYFGAPLSKGLKTDAQSAIRVARRISERLPNLNQQWSDSGYEPWQHVIVLSAGTVICGNIGSPERLDYTVIGDAVNRASRLEAVAKRVNAAIVLSESVVERADAQSQCKLLGRFPLRGQDDQPVFALIENGNSIDQSSM